MLTWVSIDVARIPMHAKWSLAGVPMHSQWMLTGVSIQPQWIFKEYWKEFQVRLQRMFNGCGRIFN